jgi:hypothetical protein
MRVRPLLALAGSLLTVAATFAACAPAPYIDASDYDESCSDAGDCAPVISGQIQCCQTDCDDNAAVNSRELPEYAADTRDRYPDCQGKECSNIACPPPPVACKAGKCVLADAAH